MAVRGLSVRQPWASLIASGEKTIELRSWSTRYRGDLLILAGGEPWKGDHGHEIGPLGVSLCLVRLVDVRPFLPGEDTAASCVPPHLLESGKRYFSWVLEFPRALPQRKTKGKLGLFIPDPALLRSLRIAA